MIENEENYLITFIGFNYRTRKEASVFLKQGNVFSGYQYCMEDLQLGDSC